MPSLRGSVASIAAFTLPNRLPTPLNVSEMVLPGSVMSPLAVPSGFSAVRPAAFTTVPAVSISASFAVASISLARTRNSVVPLMWNVPHRAFTVNTYW